jgi:hypothetical protein
MREAPPWACTGKSGVGTIPHLPSVVDVAGLAETLAFDFAKVAIARKIPSHDNAAANM